MHYPPKDIYDLIVNGTPWNYGVADKEKYVIRDRAGIALTYLSGGRVSAVFGGWKYKWNPNWGKEHGRKPIGKRFDKETGKEIEIYEGRSLKTKEEYKGIQVEDVLFRPDKDNPRYIRILEMEVAKRSEKVIKRYGHADTRESFDIPLVTGEFKERFYEQLIPFGWLVKEYIDTCAPKHGKLFMIRRSRAQQIIKTMTCMYPHWLRAQAEHFYGHYIFKDAIKLAEFLKVQDPKQIMRYTKFSADSQHKESEVTFDWIQPEVERIQKRIAEEKRRFEAEYDF